MSAGRLRAVVCTSTLDLGVDWGDVDLVINVGAPKARSRLMQRIGRANHRLDEPSRARAGSRQPLRGAGMPRRARRRGRERAGQPPSHRRARRAGAAHSGRACGEPFLADALYEEVRTAAPYAALARADFDASLAFVATGGYALKAYERFAKIKRRTEGRPLGRHPSARGASYRMNVGTIVEADMLKVRLVRARGRAAILPRGGRLLGEVEEYFIEMLTPGEAFVFAGEILNTRRSSRTRSMSRTTATDAKLPVL